MGEPIQIEGTTLTFGLPYILVVKSCINQCLTTGGDSVTPCDMQIMISHG